MAAPQAGRAQPEPAPAPTATASKAEAGGQQIVVTGRRGSIVTDLQPIATFDANAIAASGATTIGELLRSIRAVTQSADGSDPIFLLNGQRVSGYDEIGTLPPEAIDKVEVLPEPEALKFGYPPTRRVLNFITKRRFQQHEIKAEGGTSTDGGSRVANENYSLTRLHDDARLTLSIEHRHAGRLLVSDRDIAPDPGIPFDAVGNVTGVSGGEIDPALSAAAGETVIIAPVPDAVADRSALSAYAAGANQPRLFGFGDTRTLRPGTDAYKANAVIADRIGRTLAGSLSLSAERSTDSGLNGPDAAALTVPAGNPYSPFAGPVILDRYLTEVDPMRERQTTTTLHAGGTLRGAIAGWRWDLTGSVDQQQVNGRSDRSIDLTAANAAIAAGADPFVPLDPALLGDRLVDHSRLRTRSAGAKTVVTNTPVRLPAGLATITATAEIERADATSSTRGPDSYALDLGRTRVEGAIAVDLPIASRREGFLPALGDLSASASGTLRHVGSFGTLTDHTIGLTWGPMPWLQLLGQLKASEAAPALQQLSTPVLTAPNVPLFDFETGATDIVTLTTGGNPDLRAEHRRAGAITANIKPLPKSELRFAATYEDTRIDDQVGTIYASTAAIAAALPDLFVRDDEGRVVSASFQPRNFFRERQHTLTMTVSASGMLGKPPPDGTDPGKAPPRTSYYGGIGPTVRFSDRLQLEAGAPVIDLLDGGTVTGGATARASGYAYGGINRLGNGLTFDCWYSEGSRIRSDDPASDLRFAPFFRLNLGGTLSVHHVLPRADWTKHLQLKLDLQNATNARQQVRDGNGQVPNRYQPDYLDPLGRTVSLTIRKLL